MPEQYTLYIPRSTSFTCWHVYATTLPTRHITKDDTKKIERERHASAARYNIIYERRLSLFSRARPLILTRGGQRSIRGVVFPVPCMPRVNETWECLLFLAMTVSVEWIQYDRLLGCTAEASWWLKWWYTSRDRGIRHETLLSSLIAKHNINKRNISHTK